MSHVIARPFDVLQPYRVVKQAVKAQSDVGQPVLLIGPLATEGHITGKALRTTGDIVALLKARRLVVIPDGEFKIDQLQTLLSVDQEIVDTGV